MKSFHYGAIRRILNIKRNQVKEDHIKNKEIRKEALTLLIDTLSKLAKDSGCRLILTSVINKSLEQRYLDSGFISTDRGVNNFIKIL